MKLAAVAPVALLLAHGVAHAQPSAPVASEEAADTGQLGDIIVTADRRTQSVQDSSLAIQVLSPDELAGVARPQDLQALVTGMTVAAVGPNPQVYIRGVGENTANARTQNAVSWNLDGVYLPRGSIAQLMFFDLERVEVLKGPQGTLYGRNSSGGAINILSQRPKLAEFSGNAGAEFGNYDMASLDAAVNIPLGQTFAIRASGKIIDREGYLTDGSLDQKTKAGRLRALWEPSERVSILLNADYGRIGGQGSGAVLLPVQNGNPYRSMTDQPLVYPFAFGPGTLPYTTPGVDRMVRSTTWGLNAEMNFNLGPATLTVIPSYREQNQKVISYSTTFRFGEILLGEQKTLEVRLGNDSERLNWVIGGYYFDNKDDVLVNPTQGNFNLAVHYWDRYIAKAAFGQATLTLVDGLRALGGIRYTNEKTSLDYQPGAGAFPLVPFVASGPVISAPSAKLNKTTYKVGFEYDVGADSMLYGTLSTGFKGGGFNASTPCTTGPFGPEKVKAYELGMRNRFFGNSLQVNVEGFHWTYDGQHVGLQFVDRCGAQARSTLNIGKSTIKGANADIVWRATRADTISLAVEYADGTYDNLNYIQAGIGNYAPSTGTRCSATAVGGGNFNINCSGQQITRLAKWSGRASYEHSFMLPDDGTLRAGIATRFSSKTWLDIVYGPQGRAPSYVTVDADLSYTPQDQRYNIGLFVRNLTNEEVYTGGLAISGAAGVIPAGRTGAGTRYYSATIAPPRMYGVRGRINF